MKQFFSTLTFVLLIYTTLFAQKASVAEQTSLFARLGGTEGITAIVDDIVIAHSNNPAIKARFVPYGEQPERLAVIKQHTVEFFSAGAGGDVTYTGGAMPAVHGGMNISPAEFMYVVDDVMMVLDKHNIDAESKKDVLAIFWSLKGMVIGQ
jgi:hemoglobin